MPKSYIVDDAQFAAVVARCRSWRQVLRETGSKMTGTNAARLRAARLNLDVSHFTGARRWTDDELRDAVAEAQSWNEVALRLGCPATSAKRRAMRLSLEYGHLDRRAQASLRSLPADMQPQLDRVRFAGENLAAAWLQLAGCTVAMVPGQAPYDIVAGFPDGSMKKVQVKTTQTRQLSDRGLEPRPRFSLTVFAYVSALERAHLPYSGDEVDYFFLIASIDEMWFVPHARLAGQTSCNPGPEYDEFRVHWPVRNE
ncbi:hypothetical protein [Micromonospora zamorensis]|uniref:hypothetical protein n=1 Tax=Micromonospora zamorensis TaxID=709883 RepID=UPI0037B86BF9